MPGYTHMEESTEMYLKAIYRLEREGPGVTTSALASELGVAPASASGLLKKLAAEGYVEHRARGEARLTDRGLAVGVRVVRRHRLAERLLVDVLGMGWEDVQTEACMLEHAISARVEERLLDFLGHPTTCPHGRPIPPADLSDADYPGVPLAQLGTGDEAEVYGVPDEVPEILRYLGEIGLRPGAQVRVVEKAPLGGPVTVAIGERSHAISLELARMVVVLLPQSAAAAIKLAG
ncbi:MAG: metal-dependent transcriptional regulator [Vulcanimicrobiaceae bacterium]